MRNSFEVEENMVNIANGKVATANISKDMTCAQEIGEQKCMTFIKECILDEELDLFAKLETTKLKTFSTVDKKARVTTGKGQLVELKSDFKFISRLLGVRKPRNVDMKF